MRFLIMQNISLANSNDYIWYLYYLNAARLIIDGIPCFSTLGFYLTDENTLELRGDEDEKVPPRFYHDDYNKFISMLNQISRNYPKLRNNNDYPAKCTKQNELIDNLTIYQYFSEHSYMLGVKYEEIAKLEDRAKKETLKSEFYEPSLKYKSLKEKIFLAESVLMRIDKSDLMIKILRSIDTKTEKIDQYIFEHPEKNNDLRRYSTYYLPMLGEILDKFCNTYELYHECKEFNIFKKEIENALQQAD